ncbi:hypothetical protein [Ekhidna sp.]|uniref:hypothetical protein n=1 Tax=Ekhidna sp. TaxID=2608089 RepID=UPI0032EAF6F9
MKKWISLIFITGILLLAEYFFGVELNLHSTFNLMVLFFAIQGFVLFRIDHWTPKEWSTQMSLVKIVIRLLSSLVFITVLMFTQSDQFNLVIQFIILYLIFMIFEIVMALTNLRRN